jgi:hypothetical protein
MGRHNRLSPNVPVCFFQLIAIVGIVPPVMGTVAVLAAASTLSNSLAFLESQAIISLS